VNPSPAPATSAAPAMRITSSTPLSSSPAGDAIAGELRARPLADEIEAPARRARIELAATAPAPAPVADDLGLTPREREVLGQLALGRTNRQIAGELFISVKTAGVHVSHILEKLGASTRTEAATAAHRLGLVP
jgi:DNA-binding NarL/FixJ family response regulator